MLGISPTGGRSWPRFRFRCPDCKENHDGLPAMTYRLPGEIFALSEVARNERALISADLCILDDERYFIRCRLAVPVRGRAEEFEFGPWLEVTGPDFARYATGCAFATTGWLKSMQGGLANDLAGMGTTMGILCQLDPPAAKSERPSLVVLDTDTEIGRAQSHGVTVERVVETVGSMKGFMLLID